MPMSIDDNYWDLEARWLFYRKWKKRSHWKQRNAIMRFRRAIRKGGVAIDCGANVGDITAMMLDHGMTVYAFEPDPMAFKVLEERHRSNPRARLHQQAVGGSARTVTLLRSSDAAGGDLSGTVASSIQPLSHATENTGITIDVIDLCRFISDLDQPVRVLKLDIEGSEIEVINALIDNGVARKIDLILVETHERFHEELALETDKIRKRIEKEGLTNIDLNWP